MKYFKTFVCILIWIVGSRCNAQIISPPASKIYNFTFYGGMGPNFYFNNLVLANDYVNPYNFSFAGKIMWEPEYNISLGIESGYYLLYRLDLDFGASNGSVHIINSVIPIQIVVSMKFFENYYCSFSLGQSILKNIVRTTAYGDFNSTTFSFGDYSVAMGYKKLVNTRIFLGTEIKGYYSSKLDDKNIALLFTSGFRF